MTDLSVKNQLYKGKKMSQSHLWSSLSEHNQEFDNDDQSLRRS